jgi:hypothetical protein
MASEFKIDLVTGNRFWTPKGLGAMGMDPHRAISELVANSLDWRRPKKDKVESIIFIIISKSSIEIRDNGVGMNVKELQDAIQVSVSNDERRKNLRIRKGMFGMGMKVACLSLGWKMSIKTRSINEPSKENELTINTRLLDNNDEGKKNYRNQIKGRTSTWDLTGPLDSWESGTSILIEDLTNKSLSAAAVRDTLQEVFRPEIAVEQARIEVIEKNTGDVHVCEKTEIPVIEQSIIKLDDLELFVKDDETKKPIKIKGWIALMKSAGSGTGKWGLHLFKNNQVIERYHQLPSRLGGLMPKNPHPVYARTYGEIHLDMCKPAFHKVGFDYSTDSWKVVQQLLEPHIKVVMEASQQYKASDHEKAQRSIKAIQKHRKAIKTVFSRFKNKTKDDQKPDNALSLPDGNWFTIVEPIFEGLSENEKAKPWIYHFREESKELAIIINKNSPVYYHIEDHHNEDALWETVINWSISDCLISFLYDKFDFTLSNALTYRDDQLSRLFQIEEEGAQ